jgi:hypothetical protein
MVTLNAHFDGKVIIPDEPLALKPNQKIRISVEPIDAVPAKEPRTDWHSLIGIARNGDPRTHDPATDEDALWENGPLPRR